MIGVELRLDATTAIVHMEECVLPGVLLNSKMFVTSAALAEVSALLNIKCHSGCVNLSQSA